MVEGAGGFHVPLSDDETGADLAQALALPVVLVVGLRLGCLNHAALTAEAIHARGLTLAGWVANRMDPAMRPKTTTSPGCSAASMRRCWPTSPTSPRQTRGHSHPPARMT